MITSANTRRQRDVNAVPQQPVAKTPRYTILLAEHRDEVFARLAADLADLGHSVSRATEAAEIPRLYALAKASCVICNFQLPHTTGWLTATKLKMYHPNARIWVYMARKDDRDRTWAKLSGIERIIYYQGNLFRLADHVRQDLLHPGLLRYPVSPQCRDAWSPPAKERA